MSTASPYSISYAASSMRLTLPAQTLICCFVILCAVSPSDCLHQQIIIIVCCTATWSGLFLPPPVVCTAAALTPYPHSSEGMAASFKSIWVGPYRIISMSVKAWASYRCSEGCLLCPHHCDIIVPTDHTWRENIQKNIRAAKRRQAALQYGWDWRVFWCPHLPGPGLHQTLLTETPPWPPLPPPSPHSPLSNLTDLHDVGCHSLALPPPVHLFPIVYPLPPPFCCHMWPPPGTSTPAPDKAWPPPVNPPPSVVYPSSAQHPTPHHLVLSFNVDVLMKKKGVMRKIDKMIEISSPSFVFYLASDCEL